MAAPREEVETGEHEHLGVVQMCPNSRVEPIEFRLVKETESEDDRSESVHQVGQDRPPGVARV